MRARRAAAPEPAVSVLADELTFALGEQVQCTGSWTGPANTPFSPGCNSWMRSPSDARVDVFKCTDCAGYIVHHHIVKQAL